MRFHAPEKGIISADCLSKKVLRYGANVAFIKMRRMWRNSGWDTVWICGAL